MRIEDESILDLFRGPGVCEWCKLLVRKRHPHHIHSRGAGRLDIPVNLIALCETFSGGKECHGRVHSGEIGRYDLLAIVATREGMLQMAIVEMVQRLRRMPGDSILCPWCHGIGTQTVYSPLVAPFPGPCCTCGGNGAVTADGGVIPRHRVREAAP